MTWHDISQRTTLPHLTSPHNQPHYFISPRSHPHDIMYHITAQYIKIDPRTTETHPATTKTPPPNGMADGWFTQKNWFGHRTASSPCAHSIGKFFLWFIVLFLLELPPPACPGTTCSCINNNNAESDSLPNFSKKNHKNPLSFVESSKKNRLFFRVGWHSLLLGQATIQDLLQLSKPLRTGRRLRSRS